MRPSLQGHLAMLAFSACVAGSFSLGSTVANDIAPAALNAVRFWIAATLIAGVAWQRGVLTSAVFVAPWRYLVLGGLFGAYLVLMLEGLKTAPPVSTSAVFTLTPIMSGLFGWLLLRQVVSGRIAGALAIGAAGALWVIFRADLGALMAFDIGKGEATYFIGCVAHALYTPLVKRLNRGEPALISSLGTLVAGGVIVTLWGTPDIMATDWSGLPTAVWVAIFYMACAATAVTVVLIQFASLRLPSSKVMAYTYLTPSWVIMWEIALHGVFPPLAIITGIALTLVALALLLRD